MLTVQDIFSGIGAFTLGLESTGGFKTVQFCEIDPFCRHVLARHWPEVPCHDDVTTLEPQDVDVIVGGFPCQDVSCAGKRAGLAGERSGLYRELVRTIRVVRPKYAIMENVAALLGDGLDTVLGDLAEGGIDAEWDCVPASTVGAPHERDRIWIVAHPHGIDRRAGTGHQKDRKEAGDGVDQAGLADAADADSQWRQQPPLSGEEIRVRLGDGAQNAPHPSGEQMGAARQPRGRIGMGSGIADAPGLGCGQGRSWRPPDSFARVRDEARRNAADPYGARLAFRAGLCRDAWEKLSPAERDAISDGGQSIWPDEPALSGVDDGTPHWMDRVRSTGNTIVPHIPALIGHAILDAEGLGT